MLILILIELIKYAPIIGGSYKQDTYKNVDLNLIWLIKYAPIIGGTYKQDTYTNLDLNFNLTN
jgi:hypothetical protein